MSASAGAAPLDLAAFDRMLDETLLSDERGWRPWILRLSPGDREALERTCARHALALSDPIERQLHELAAVRLPAASAAERAGWMAELADRHRGLDAFGCWVVLPWDRRVIHLLDHEDYFDVITDRNRDKITREEQRLLRTRAVGVMGLSVGGEAAVALAQEHLCGRIALADFDRLDLSNLNRLGAGFDDLGVNKAVLVARRILRIDPYLDVSVFEDGVTDDNVEAFLDGLDLLVEECDGLAMKFEVRRLARARGLDVVFAADERGFLSVEPYGQSPGLPVFHGRMDGPQPPREAFQTPLDFMRALTEWMGGWEAISERSRRSLEGLGTTTCGYPQLAGEARYAAGQLAHVARRLLLGERLPPYVGHLDLERMLPGDAARGGSSGAGTP